MCVCLRTQLHLKGIIVQCTHENSNNKKRKKENLKFKKKHQQFKRNNICRENIAFLVLKHFTAFESYAVHLFTY